MKNMLLICVCAFSHYFSTAHAVEIKWVKTPFWKAPQQTSFDVKFLETGTEIKENCKRYGKIIFADDGTVNWPGQSDRVARYRTTLMADSPMHVQNFEIFFQLDTPFLRNSYLEVDVTFADENKDDSTDLLPYYTQKRSFSGASLNDISEFEIKILQASSSFTKVSRDLNLSDSKIELTRNSRGTLGLKIYGRDVACDLLNGNIELIATAPGYVGLDKEQMTKIGDFYHEKLEEELNRILSVKDEALTIKAARLGYNIGRIIDEEFSADHQINTEKKIKAIFDMVFIPKTLNVTANIVDINKRKTFRINTNAEGFPASVKFSF